MSKQPGIVRQVAQHKVTPVEGAFRISYSQLSTFLNCPRQWKLAYVDRVAPYRPSIHTVFGTALHETVQEWLDVVYNKTVKQANQINLSDLLYSNLVKEYKNQYESCNKVHFSTPEELREFHSDGVEILEYLRKKRTVYFTTKKTFLAGIETQLYLEIKKDVYFKGFIDLVFYDIDTKKWLLLDIKTSTSGWNASAKKDEKKIAQLLLYKEFFAKQFNIPVDDIDVEYFIVKRKVPEDPMYPTMSKRVQQFRPASGKVKRGQALSSIRMFLDQALDENGKVVLKEHAPVLTKTACRWCDFKNTTYCPESKNVT